MLGAAVLLGVAAESPAAGAVAATPDPARTAPARADGASPRAAATALIGAPVVGRQGERLGEVKDLVVDAARRKVVYAVVTLEGLPQHAGTLFALPLDRFRREGGRLAVDMEAKALAASPGFPSSRWPDFAEVDRFYGAQSTTTPRYLRATEMLKGDVKDSRGQDIADVRDVVVDPASGAVRYLVVQFDPTWNADERWVALPMRAFRSESADGTDLVYSATPAELRMAPAFPPAQWPALSTDPRFGAEVDRYERSWPDSRARSPR